MVQALDNAVNVLFTSVGRRVELLQAFRRAFQSLGLGGRIVAVDIDPLAPALKFADRPYIVPPLKSADYIPTLVKICRREQIQLVFPLIDPDIEVLANHRQDIEVTGASPVVVSAEAASITSDKWLTTKFLRRLGLPTPRSWLPGELDPARAEYPLFIKPRRGSAAKHTFTVHTADELAFFANYICDAIIQERLPGPEITNDVLCDLEGQVLAVASRQRIEVRWGEVAKGVTIYDQAITNACEKIAQALPAVGPITVQCMMKQGVPQFTEINARSGGGLPLAIAAGVDLPRWLLARAAGQDIEIPPLGTYKTGLYLSRFDQSVFMSDEDRARIASCRL